MARDDFFILEGGIDMKKLIAYFSASGVTEKAAKQLAQIPGPICMRLRLP